MEIHYELKPLPTTDIDIISLRLIICLGGPENDFQSWKIIFSSPQNKLSDVNKTSIDISNRQKFEL